MGSLRTLLRSTGRMWAEAFYEVVIISVLCLLPLFGVAYWTFLNSGEGERVFLDYLASNISKGQLAFYAISNWATVVWLCSKELKNILPGRALIISFCIAGFFYSGVLISADHLLTKPQSSVINSSFVIYAASIVFYFFVTLYDKIPPPSAEDTNNAGALSLRKRLRERMGRANG